MVLRRFLVVLGRFRKKHDIRIFRDCIRSDSEKGDIEKKQKITF